MFALRARRMSEGDVVNHAPRTAPDGRADPSTFRRHYLFRHFSALRRARGFHPHVYVMKRVSSSGDLRTKAGPAKRPHEAAANTIT
jgi:hypothetical protein